jgi:hypothetical protein
MIEWLTKARKRGCPLLAIQTPEPLGALQVIGQDAIQHGALAWAWDCAAGLQARTTHAEEFGTEEHCAEPDLMLQWAQRMPSDGLMLAQWHQEYWQDARVRQGIMNLRDAFKRSGRTLALLGRQLTVPANLHSDFLLYTERLPGTEELESVVDEIETHLPVKLTQHGRTVAIDALRGMTRFEAEQVTAMSYLGTSEQSEDTKGAIRIAELWQAKVRLINDTPGLQCWQGGECAGQVKGLNALLQDFQDIRDGRLPVRLVIWIDESEDVLAGVEGDTSGISQDYLGTLAKHIQDTEAQSILLAGHPGTGKSLSAKVAGSVFGCLVLALDLGACKGSLVGESENNLRHALAIERAIVGNQLGSTLWIWTTNNAEALPHKLRARMQGEYFCDLPGEQESLAIWSLYRARYEIPQSDAFPSCEGWTGREIARCCRLAWQYKRTLQEASTRIVPIRVSQAKAIQERRKQASGRYLDASRGGVFSWQEQREGRKVEV